MKFGQARFEQLFDPPSARIALILEEQPRIPKEFLKIRPDKV